MDSSVAGMSSPPGEPDPAPGVAPFEPRSAWQRVKGRIVSGLLIVMPILITLWLFHWMYSTVATRVIDPIAHMVLWKSRRGQADADLPYWFETYAAPLIAIVLVLILLYFLGFFAQSRMRRAVDWVLLRVPIMSGVYEGVRSVFQSMERQSGKKRSQRVVLIPFPHPGMRVAGFVTAMCQDPQTQKTLLCVYVPQSPLPTNGHLVLVPEEDVTPLNWSPEETLQTLISAGFTAPQTVTYTKAQAAIATEAAPPVRQPGNE